MKIAKAVVALGAGFALGCAFNAQGETTHWTYRGHGGPSEWGALSQEFATCKLGRISPRSTFAAPRPPTFLPIRFDYKPSPLKVIDNGHTIQVNYAPGSSIDLGGVALRTRPVPLPQAERREDRRQVARNGRPPCAQERRRQARGRRGAARQRRRQRHDRCDLEEPAEGKRERSADPDVTIDAATCFRRTAATTRSRAR